MGDPKSQVTERWLCILCDQEAGVCRCDNERLPCRFTKRLPPPSFEEAATRLYKYEINCGVSSFWDGGWTAWIGDEMNGRRVEEIFAPEELRKVGAWLISEASSLFPDIAKALSEDA